MTAEEKAMMDELLAGLDDCFSDYHPTPVKKEIPPTPTLAQSPCASRSKNTRDKRTKTPKKRPSPSPLKVKRQKVTPSPLRRPCDLKGKSKDNIPPPRFELTPGRMGALLEGMDEVDWDDMEEEALKPNSKAKVKLETPPTQVSDPFFLTIEDVSRC
jgi:hypothetical protein